MQDICQALGVRRFKLFWGQGYPLIAGETNLCLGVLAVSSCCFLVSSIFSHALYILVSVLPGQTQFTRIPFLLKAGCRKKWGWEHKSQDAPWYATTLEYAICWQLIKFITTKLIITSNDDGTLFWIAREFHKSWERRSNINILTFSAICQMRTRANSFSNATYRRNTSCESHHAKLWGAVNGAYWNRVNSYRGENETALSWLTKGACEETMKR